MNRQRILVAFLIVVAVTLLPSYFADQAAARLKKEIATMETEMEVLRAKALKVNEEEEKLAAGQAAMDGLQARLLTPNPFADMERAVKDMATRAGLQVVELNLVGAEQVKELPTLVRYSAAVEVVGTTGALIQFVRLAEQHALLIEVPDLKLTFPRTSPGTSQPPTPAATRAPATAPAPAQPPIRTRLTFYFFGGQ